MACGVVMRVRVEDLAWQEVEGDMVVLDLRTSTYVTLNRAASQLWPMLVQGDTEANLAGKLVQQYGLPADRAHRDVQDFVANLRINDLLIES